MIFVLVFAAQLLSWFFIAPDARFVYGCLLSGAIIFAVVLLNDSNLGFFNRVQPVLYFFLVAGVLFYGVSKARKNKSLLNMLWPAELPAPPTREMLVDGIPVRIPEIILNNWNRRCYGTELPCLYILDPKLRARGKTIRQGFRLEK
jgi:hypothetical protein